MRFSKMWIGVFLVVVGISAKLKGQEVIHLSLAEALSLAPKANYSILVGEERLVSAEQAMRKSRANLLPSVSLDASQSRSQGYYDFGSDVLKPRTDRFDAVLSARLSLFDVNDWADYKVSQFNQEIGQLELDILVEDVLEAIGSTYFAHLRNERRLMTIEADMERDAVLLEIAQHQLDAGTATPLDVTRAEVRLSVNSLRKLQQETAVYESGLNLKQALNLNLGAELELEPFPVSAMALASYDSSHLDSVYERRSEVVREVKTLERNKVARRAADYAMLPSLTLTGQWGGASKQFDNDLNEQWAVALGFSMPIFEGYRIDADKRLAASAVRSQESVLAETKMGVEAGYRLALEKVRSQFKQVALSKKQVELAEKELNLARIRFEEGVADNSEVVTAQAGLAEANDGMVESEYLYQLAQIKLARERGSVRTLLGGK